MPSKKEDASVIEKKLIENLVQLQRAETNLAEKVNRLTDHISKLLSIFEEAAKSFGKQIPEQSIVTEKDKDFLQKIDRLLDQNKTIAKGLTLMEERIRDKLHGKQDSQESYQPQYGGRPVPKF